MLQICDFFYDAIFSETFAPQPQKTHRRQMAFHHFNGFNEKMSSSEYGIPGEKKNKYLERQVVLFF